MAANNYEDLVVALRADISGLKIALGDAQKILKNFDKQIERDTVAARSAVSALRGEFLKFVSVWQAFRVAKGIVDAGLQMQALQNKMVAATGSTKIAADALAFARSEAERLGLRIQDASNGFAGFSASALRAGLTLQQTKDIFTGVSEAAVSMRLSSEQTQLVFKALEQIAGKGTVNMEELRQQLGDSLPGAFEIAAKAMGKTTSEFAKMVANGQVLSADFLPKFGEAVRRELGGSVNEASQSAQAAFNRLGNAFFDLQVQFANSGFLDVVTEGVKDLTAALNDPANQEGFKQFAELLAEMARLALEAASAIGGLYGKINQTVEGVGNGIFGSLFGEEGTKALEEARKRRQQFGSASIRADNASTSEYKGNAELDGMLREAEAGMKTSNGGYSLGKPTTVAPSQGEAAAARIRESLRNRVDAMRAGFITEMDPNKQDSAKAVADLNKQYETEQDLLDKALKKKAISQQEYQEATLKAEMDYQARMAGIQQQYREDFLSDQEAFAEGFLGVQLSMQNKSLVEQGKSFRNSISQAAQHNKIFFELEKAAAIAQALLSARQTVVDAYAFGTRLGGPPLGFAFAGVAAAAQAANIAAIASTSYGGGSGGVSSGGGSTAGTAGTDTSGASSAPTAPSKTVYINLQGDDSSFFSKNNIRKLIDSLNDASLDGSKLIVQAA